MDGFFGNASSATSIDSTNEHESVDLFAQAIAGRFNNSDKPLLTARLTPSNLPSNSPMTGVQHASLSLQPTPMPTLPLFKQSMSLKFPSPRRLPSLSAPSTSAPTISSAASTDFTTATASTLQEILNSPNTLIIDVRPHSAYLTSRIPHAVSLSVPTTLLKRPAFSLQKLALMLSSPSARMRIQNFNKASRILVYDADSSQLLESSNLLGLMRKFRAVQFTGEIAWLQGGIQSLWKEHRHLVDEDPASEDEEENESSSVLRARCLPQSAFQHSSTTAANVSTSTSLAAKSLSLSDIPKADNDGSKADGQLRRTAANPFYDNIRQNLELSQGITERIPLKLSPKTSSRVKEIPFAWLRGIASTAGRDECTEALAMQFYRIELGEQRRLQGIMAHHSTQTESSQSVVSAGSSLTVKEGQDGVAFPYSIIAGVEKGGKNRYRNIWPFEHSRVRLQDENDDYVNASFVQPLGSRKRYIATQGPLPQTFSDFWTVVWDQGVHVIVMLTRQFEGGSLKCGKYWENGQYGALRLRMIKREGSVEEDDTGGSSGGFFAEEKDSRRSPSIDDGHNHTIRRVFELINTALPDEKPRTVTQLQYLGWPDMDVPTNPKSLLKLMFEVDTLAATAQHDHYRNKGRETPTQLPILMHCSAGVGRTGAFIIIDAILDSVRLEIRAKLAAEKARLAVTTEEEKARAELQSIVDKPQPQRSDMLQRIPSENAMDVDGLSVSSSVCSGPSKSSAPTSDSDAPSSASEGFLHDFETPMPSSFRTYEHVGTRAGQEVSNSDRGQVVTLPIGNEAEGIHVPLVPSSTSPGPVQTPRASAYRSLHPSDSMSNGASSRSPVQSLHSVTRPQMSSTDPGSIYVQRQRQRQAGSRFSEKPVMNDFTVDDADSMFENETNPDFAMDIESVQTQRDALLTRPHHGHQVGVCNESHQCEHGGFGNGADVVVNPGPMRVKEDSGSGSGSGSECYQIRPLRKAFAELSSADDESGSMPKYDSSRIRSLRGAFGATASDGSASGSGEGGVSSASDASGKASSGGARRGSSVGLDAFSAMGVNSPIPSPGHKPMADRERRTATSLASAFASGGGSIQASEPRGPTQSNMPMNKTSLIQPKPLRLQPSRMPELIEGVECSSSESTSDKQKQSRPTAQLPLRHRQGKRSSSSSTNGSTAASSVSSVPSSSSSSLLRSGGEDYETPPSMESLEQSRSPSSTSQQKQISVRKSSSTSERPALQKTAGVDGYADERSSAFDYTAPRMLARNSKDAPPLLSSLNEPIRQVLEDMREQRMSLCQSLRQYVFVHNAIVEGAIIILDEECEALDIDPGLDAAGAGIEDVLKGIFEGSPLDGSPLAEPASHELSSGLPSTGGGGSASGFGSAEESQLSGKRRSSPTELPKKDYKGIEKLTKRPSMKRGKSSSPGSNSSASPP